MADWAYLPHELLVVIVAFVKRFQDFAAFRSVCKSWNAVASKDHFKALWLQERSPYLMLPFRDRNVRDLYSLAGDEIVASVRFRNNLSKRKCYESLGWFLSVEKDCSMSLFDPFSRTEIQLPHLNTLSYFQADNPFIVKKMVLSARPTNPNDPSDFSVALIFRGMMIVAFWMPGEELWETSMLLGPVYQDITYHAGNFYSIDSHCQVMRFYFDDGFLEEDQEIAGNGPGIAGNGPGGLPNLEGMNVYIVKMPDSLLLVTRSFLSCYERTTKFEVYEFHLSSNTWIKINSLGNMALFLGSGSATTIVDASRFPEFLKANHIYFTDDGKNNLFGDFGEPNKLTGQDMGIYNLGNERIDPFYHGEAFSRTISHPAWILPFLWSSTADEMHTL